MITMEKFWMGRDTEYADELTDDIQRNAVDLITRVNGLLGEFFDNTGIVCDIVASGWRPHEINDSTANSASHSKHLSGDAVDIRDTPKRDLAVWCALNAKALGAAGLWCERFEWTGGPSPWVHFQRLPPTSNKRFFIPSMNPPLCARLPEQDIGNC